MEEKLSALFYIIVVSYNAGEKLTKTVQSILGQDCGDYRVVIKDGGSTDGSLEDMLAHLESIVQSAITGTNNTYQGYLADMNSYLTTVQSDRQALAAQRAQAAAAAQQQAFMQQQAAAQQAAMQQQMQEQGAFDDQEENAEND